MLAEIIPHFFKVRDWEVVMKMIGPEDERWLKRVLKECFGDISYDSNIKELDSFKILLVRLIKNLEKKVKEAQVLWKIKPQSKELKDTLSLLEKNLSYLRRFCARR